MTSIGSFPVISSPENKLIWSPTARLHYYQQSVSHVTQTSEKMILTNLLMSKSGCKLWFNKVCNFNQSYKDIYIIIITLITYKL